MFITIKSPQKISVPNSRKLIFKILSLVGGVPENGNDDF